MRLLFLGTPDFAVPTLRALHAAGHEVDLVVTRPDRPRRRSGTPEPPEVKVAALELGLPVYQPERANTPETIERLRAEGAQLGVVVAYGELLGAELLGTTAAGLPQPPRLSAAWLPGRGAHQLGHHPRGGGDRRQHHPHDAAPRRRAGPGGAAHRHRQR